MNLETFRGTLAQPQPPDGLDWALQGLWWAARDDWQRAHECVQQAEGTERCDWVHAHLHRIEGDAGNAGYWYRRAGRELSGKPFEDEWADITGALLASADVPIVKPER